MSRDWTFYLEDILNAARKILRYTEGIDFDEFNRNELIVDGVVHNLEIIGEAAKHLPDEARAMMPDIEWSKAAAFRDVIAHHYFGLNIDVVWNVVCNKVPEIASTAEALLKSLSIRQL